MQLPAIIRRHPYVAAGSAALGAYVVYRLLAGGSQQSDSSAQDNGYGGQNFGNQAPIFLPTAPGQSGIAEQGAGGLDLSGLAGLTGANLGAGDITAMMALLQSLGLVPNPATGSGSVGSGGSTASQQLTAEHAALDAATGYTGQYGNGQFQAWIATQPASIQHLADLIDQAFTGTSSQPAPTPAPAPSPKPAPNPNPSPAPKPKSIFQTVVKQWQTPSTPPATSPAPSTPLATSRPIQFPALSGIAHFSPGALSIHSASVASGPAPRNA